ncbi:MAG: hypothetical protein HY332_00180 [Chloroflexi bacterium]|nr:hypothetical protein [Chloroflexota bacterium]
MSDFLETTTKLPGLAPFYYDPATGKGWITDVLLMVKSGKEATVYCCQAHPSTGVDLLAAKVYHPLGFGRSNTQEVYQEAALRHTFERKIRVRRFKRAALYTEGRVLRETRLQRAFEKKSKKGREAQNTSWAGYEYETLCLLHAAGADVPRPVARSGFALLLEYVGDHSGPAQMLSKTSLAREEARPLFERLLWNVGRWLACHRVHADLSAYNVLYWQGALKAIDFPQSVDPRFNPHARSLLVRDLQNVCGYFARYGVAADPYELADDLWLRYMWGELV